MKKKYVLKKDNPTVCAIVGGIIGAVAGAVTGVAITAAINKKKEEN